MNNINKLILGTVQFGLKYGINNSVGQVSKEEVKNILDYAHIVGIKTLDTAAGYGDSEERIGDYHHNSKDPFHIITKFSKGATISWEESLKESIKKLYIEKVDVVMFHSFEHYYSVKSELPTIINKGRDLYFDKIGVSVYTNNELEQLLYDDNVEVVQLPFNLLDNESLRANILKRLKEKGKIIHTRSTFLQGLFYKNISSLDDKFNDLIPLLTHINELVRENKININTLAMQYVLSKEYIDGVLIGVDSSSQLKENITSLQNNISKEVLAEIDKIKIKNVDLLNPSKW